MIPRTAAQQVLDYAQWFPVISVTGPRQSGKSTLVKNLFPNYTYLNLEDEHTYRIVADAPADFLREHPGKLVIDEAQRIPELFSAIQVASDELNEPGHFILSGSQNFLLSKHINQSLAGRVGLVKLLPFSYPEIAHMPLSVDDFMITGGYPRLYDANIPAQAFYRNYIATYVERDASDYLGPSSLSAFRTFLTLCAQAAGNLINISRLAADIGVARATVESWLSILETSYIVFRLPPYFANLRKRLTKTPKLYFYDTGLLCYLLGIHTIENFRDSDLRGAIFENLIIAETLKRHLNSGVDPQLYFYRNDSKVEVDLVDLTQPNAPELAEIKSGLTYQPAFIRHLTSVAEELNIPKDHRFLVLRAPNSAPLAQSTLASAKDWLLRS